jgi:hypothetical protein
MRILLRPAVAATVAALALVLAGCAGDSEPANQADDTAGQVDEEESGDSEGAAAGEEVDPAEFVDDMRAGLEASTTTRMSMTVDAAGQRLEADGQLDYTARPPDTQMTMTMPAMSQEPIELRMVDGVMYMNMGAMTQGKFVSFDLKDPKNLPPGMAGLTDQLDPLSGFAEFEQAITRVTYVGEEDVEGEQLAHYQLVVDTTKAAGFQGLPSGEGVPDEVTVDTWFDEEFRARRMQTSLDAGQQSAEMDIQMSDWGEPVSIEAPPAGKVIDPSQMMQGRS